MADDPSTDKIRQGRKNKRVRRTLFISTVVAIIVLGLITIIATRVL